VTDERRRIDEFMGAATAFRQLCENAEELGRDGFLSRLARELPRLQAAAADLPDVQPASAELPLDAERQSPPDAVWRLLPEDWGEVQGSLHETVGGAESLATVFVVDDLGDIYDDVVEGFDILDAGFPDNEAVWHWRFGFWTHWGYHVAEAQRVIHYYVALHALYGNR
jgi:Domain of unknown function (DUF5063)